MDPYGNDTVDDFLDKVKQLEIKTREEDMRRSQKLKDELSASYSRSTFNPSRDILIPNPVAREESYEYKPYRGTLVSSDAIQKFDSQASDEYQVDLESLKYESAYNFEKSGSYSKYQPTHARSLQDSHVVNEDRDLFEARPKPPPRKTTDMPEIIRFEDFITKRSSCKPTSRYSKFQITDEEKSEIDKTLGELVGNDGTVYEDENEVTQPLTRHHKGGSISQNWSSAAMSKPKLSPPIKFTNSSSPPLPELPTRRYKDPDLNDLKRSPRKIDLLPEKNATPSTPSTSLSASPIKKSPAKIDFAKYTDSKPEIKPKPLSYTQSNPEPIKPRPPVKNAWLSSVLEKSSSSTQGLPTDSKIRLSKPLEHKSWLDSAKTKSPSLTSQGSSTESKIHVDKTTAQTSWLESAKKKAPSSHQFIEKPSNKIKIQTNGTNTLKKNLSMLEEMDKERTSTLEELHSTKLHHISERETTKSPETVTVEPAFSPIALKKTRPSKPSKSDHLAPEFSNQKLSSTKPVQRKVSDVPEALKKSQSLKPAIKAQRKVSEEPEAFKKSKSLKPALPARKPSYKVPEALEKVNKLKHSQGLSLPTKEDDPEGLVQLKNLKPSKPLRKPSVKELEALESLKKIKAKSSGPPPLKPKNARVVSQSKELLQSQIGRLKSVKKGEEQQKEDDGKFERRPSPEPVPEPQIKDTKKAHINNLESLLLKRASTDPNVFSSSSKSTIQDNTPLRKAATFGPSKSTKDTKLDHIIKKRAKGPKRRVPKSLQ